MILDGEQDEAFLVFDEERFFLLFDLCMLLLLLGRVFDDVFLADEDGGVFLSSAGARKLFLHKRDRVVCFCAEIHF
jgi:hypothetical protein